MNIIDHTTLAVEDSSVGLEDATITLTVAKAAGAQGAIMIVEDDSVYCRTDGDAATNVDAIFYKGDVINMWDGNWIQPMEKIRFLRVTTNATVQIIYLGA